MTLSSRAALLALVCCPVVLLSGCGAGKPQATPATVSSDAYSCTDAGLARLGDLRRTVVRALPGLASRARLRNYCGGGLDASVEFTLHGRVAATGQAVREALDCGAPRSRAGATGRTIVMRCHTRGLTFRTTVAPYLPADDPRGPTVLGEATLLGQ